MNEEFGWHSQGYLPHLDALGRQFLTWRLDDAVPLEALETWKAKLVDEGDKDSISWRNRGSAHP